MDVPTLILLGAAGGLVRGALDLYSRFVAWQADRQAHRQAITAHGEVPRFQAYFDFPVDIAAAAVHTVMGAGTAVLFGATGQISGKYAALVVGMSAPVLLTQLIRIQTVNDAVSGDRQPAASPEEAAPAAGAEPTAGVPGGPHGTGDAQTPATSGVGGPGLPAEPMPASPADPGGPPPRVCPLPSPGVHPAVADVRMPDAAPGEHPAHRSPSPEPAHLRDSPVRADPGSGTTERSREGRSASHWHRTELGEEGL